MRGSFEKNPFLGKVNTGKASVGLFNYSRDTAVLDIAEIAGFDFVVTDNEHIGMEREATEKLILATELDQVVPSVRVSELIPYLMRNYTEMSAYGILAPHIRSGAECRMVQEVSRYPPYGNVSCCRPNHADGFEAKDQMKYLDHAQELVLVPMTEDPEAIGHLDEILDKLKPGWDIMMSGKADYRQACGSLNVDGTFTSEVNEAYLKVMGRCRARNIGLMAYPSARPAGQTTADVKEVVEEGHSTVVLDID